jgi:hypothetical protein
LLELVKISSSRALALVARSQLCRFLRSGALNLGRF